MKTGKGIEISRITGISRLSLPGTARVEFRAADGSDGAMHLSTESLMQLAGASAVIGRTNFPALKPSAEVVTATRIQLDQGGFGLQLVLSDGTKPLLRIQSSIAAEIVRYMTEIVGPVPRAAGEGKSH